jgi:hypothetical protein
MKCGKNITGNWRMMRMKLCSECKEPLTGNLAFTEEGQEDYFFCQKCTDYCDVIEEEDEESINE